MNIVVTIIGFLHLFIFVGAVGYFIFSNTIEKYSKKEIATFIIMMLSTSVIGFFAAIHASILLPNPSIMRAVGYVAVPLTQVFFLLLTYVIVQFQNTFQNKQIRITPFLLGIVASAPISFLIMTLFGAAYWVTLGNRIY